VLPASILMSIILRVETNAPAKGASAIESNDSGFRLRAIILNLAAEVGRAESASRAAYTSVRKIRQTQALVRVKSASDIGLLRTAARRSGPHPCATHDLDVPLPTLTIRIGKRPGRAYHLTLYPGVRPLAVVETDLSDGVSRSRRDPPCSRGEGAAPLGVAVPSVRPADEVDSIRGPCHESLSPSLIIHHTPLLYTCRAYTCVRKVLHAQGTDIACSRCRTSYTSVCKIL